MEEESVIGCTYFIGLGVVRVVASGSESRDGSTNMDNVSGLATKIKKTASDWLTLAVWLYLKNLQR